MSEGIKGFLLRAGHDIDFYYISGNIADISASTTDKNSAFVSVPEDGVVEEVITVISTAITSGDAVITATTTTGVVTPDATHTIATSGSAIGTIDTSTYPFAANAVVDAGDTIKIKSDGGSTVASNAAFQIKIRRRG